MRTFEFENRFDSRTGEALTPQLVMSGYICDFCGAEIDEEDEGANSVSFSINEESGSEQSWYYHSFAKEVPTFEFWNNQDKYHYCLDEDYSDSCSSTMFIQAEARYGSLHELMQQSRINVVNKLLEEGMTPEKLGFREDQ